MALRHNDQVRGRIGFLWKTFIRGSPETPESEPKEQAYHLGFQGNEAKTAYEEIINQDNNVNYPINRKRYTKAKSNENHDNILTNPNSTGNVSKKDQSNTEVTKISTNAILKAVEQRDLKFLQKYITLENVNSSDEFGWTPLMSAAYCGHLDIVEFLLRFGANRKARERSGLTAAQLALKKNYLGIVALLKKKLQVTTNTTEIQTDNGSLSICAKAPLEDYTDDTNRDTNLIKETPHSDGGFYCDVCKRYFYETTVKKHEASTLHIFNTKPKLPLPIYGISKQNKGYQILLNTGWDEETGLGPSGKGIKYPIKTYLKIDRKGLGQPMEKEARVTHFKSGDVNAVNIKISKHKPLKKRDREKLISREARKERALRIALS